jgi:anti-anti-sigma factor
MTDFRVRVRQQDDAVVVTLTGDLDREGAPALATLESTLETGIGAVVVDARDLEFVDVRHLVACGG